MMQILDYYTAMDWALNKCSPIVKYFPHTERFLRRQAAYLACAAACSEINRLSEKQARTAASTGMGTALECADYTDLIDDYRYRAEQLSWIGAKNGVKFVKLGPITLVI